MCISFNGRLGLQYPKNYTEVLSATAIIRERMPLAVPLGRLLPLVRN